MVYRARHEGSVSHLVPVDCRACEDRHNCPLRDVVGSHCSKRDRQDRWYYLYYVRDAVTNKLRRKQISAKTRKDLYAKIDKVKEQPVQSKCTVGEWLDIWLKSIVKGSVKENVDTTTAAGRLMFTLIAAIAEFERDVLLERQREGIALAKKAGKYRGRKRKVISDIAKYYELFMNRKMTKVQIMKELHVSRTVVDRCFAEFEERLG